MARPLQVTIVESREELERRLDAQTTATGKERLQMLYWLKLGIVNTRPDLTEGGRRKSGHAHNKLHSPQS
jgi:hypothetical protein